MSLLLPLVRLDASTLFVTASTFFVTASTFFVTVSTFFDASPEHEVDDFKCDNPRFVSRAFIIKCRQRANSSNECLAIASAGIFERRL